MNDNATLCLWYEREAETAATFYAGGSEPLE